MKEMIVPLRQVNSVSIQMPIAQIKIHVAARKDVCVLMIHASNENNPAQVCALYFFDISDCIKISHFH